MLRNSATCLAQKMYTVSLGWIHSKGAVAFIFSWWRTPIRIQDSHSALIIKGLFQAPVLGTLTVQYGESQCRNEQSSLPVHRVLSWNTSNENINRADEQMCFHVQILGMFMEAVWLGIQRVHSFPFKPLQLGKIAVFNWATAGNNFLYGVRVTDTLFTSCFSVFVFALSAFVMGYEVVGGRSRNWELDMNQNPEICKLDGVSSGKVCVRKHVDFWVLSLEVQQRSSNPSYPFYS